MSRRIFFALWPDNSTRLHLKALADKSFRKPVPVSDLHMTLAFLGNCDLKEYECVKGIAENITSDSFSLLINASGNFPKVNIQWVGPAKAPDELLMLERTLASGLIDCGFPERPANKFVPHITLARRLKMFTTLEVTRPIIWYVDSFVLVETMPERLPSGGFYRVLKSWPLTKRVG